MGDMDSNMEGTCGALTFGIMEQLRNSVASQLLTWEAFVEKEVGVGLVGAITAERRFVLSILDSVIEEKIEEYRKTGIRNAVRSAAERGSSIGALSAGSEQSRNIEDLEEIVRFENELNVRLFSEMLDIRDKVVERVRRI